MGTAMGFYNWGVYIGYSLAFAFNFIVEYFKWRWAFWVAAIPGLIMGVIVMITVKEPQRKGKMVREEDRVIYLQLLCLSEPVQEPFGSF